MFNVELSVGDFDGYAVVALCGELDLFDTSDVASHLIAAVAAYGPSIIVDLAGLKFVDSCGLGVLVPVPCRLRRCSGRMPSASPNWRSVATHCPARVLVDVGCGALHRVPRLPWLAGSRPPGLAGRCDPGPCWAHSRPSGGRLAEVHGDGHGEPETTIQPGDHA